MVRHCSQTASASAQPTNFWESALAVLLAALWENSMKLVALLSGGKDSLFNVMQCEKHGHEIVAIANLRPPETSKTDELDSEMYQTVGWNAVSLMAEAMKLPFHQRSTSGTSYQKTLAYSSEIATANKSEHGSSHDEVEDLFNLLQDVIAKHPQIGGIFLLFRGRSETLRHLSKKQKKRCGIGRHIIQLPAYSSRVRMRKTEFS